MYNILSWVSPLVTGTVRQPVSSVTAPRSLSAGRQSFCERLQLVASTQLKLFSSKSSHHIYNYVQIYMYDYVCISWSTYIRIYIYSHQWLLEICTLRLIHWPWIALVARRCSPGCQEQRKLRVRWLWLPAWDVGTNPKWTEPTSESSMGRPQALQYHSMAETKIETSHD